MKMKTASVKAPEFTQEQQTYLAQILALSCCHTTGMHSPTHFQEQQYICESQKAQAWQRAVTALGFGKMVDRPTASPEVANLDPRIGPFADPDCYWCASQGLEGRLVPPQNRYMGSNKAEGGNEG